MPPARLKSPVIDLEAAEGSLIPALFMATIDGCIGQCSSVYEGRCWLVRRGVGRGDAGKNDGISS